MTNPGRTDPAGLLYSRCSPARLRQGRILTLCDPGMFAPDPNWSVFDRCRCIRIIVGLAGSLMAISPQVRWVAGQNADRDSGSSSPSVKNPKNAVQHTAQSTLFSGWEETSRWFLMRRRRSAVIVSLILDGVPCLALTLAIPACTLFSTGRDDWSRGSGRPSESCMFRTPARYDFPVCGDRPSSAKCAAKLHSKGSVTGNGVWILRFLQKP